MEIKEELLKSFHEQFAENQNHHQTLFIQFISAVFAVIVGYVIVYTNTSVDSNFWFSIKKDENITSYAIIHLISSYLFAQIILTLLCSLTINIGYGFRRDQNVIYNIRQNFLDNEEYSKFFGEKSFNPKKKDVLDFLPEFNSIFVRCIVIIQILLFISIFLALLHFSNFKFKDWFINGLLTLILLFPIFVSIIIYLIYFNKYIKVIKE